MPRLSYSRITKGDAIHALITLYRKNPNFMHEWKAIKQPYQELILHSARDMVDFWRQTTVAPDEYYKAVIEFYKTGKNDPFPAEKFKYGKQLQPYLDELDKLAYKWKIRAPWAVLVLSLYDIFDAMHLPENVEIEFERCGQLYPWSPPAPPSEIEIPAWAVILCGRGEVTREVVNRIKQYEDEIKKSGLKEYPSSLQKHAEWWFKHHVQKQTYDQIAQQEAYSPGGSLISYARNVGRAVRQFTKLIGIEMKDLK